MLLELLIGALGLSSDADEDAAMDEAVGDRGRRSSTRKQIAPLLERQIRGHDGRSALVPAVEHLVEEVRTASVEAEVAQLVKSC